MEQELEFARRHGSRLGTARRALFGDARPAGSARILPHPPVGWLAFDAAAVNELVEWSNVPQPSSPQGAGDNSPRFWTWFTRLGLPELARALDPRLTGTPLLVRGEPGSGRAALIRAVHRLGGTSHGALAHVPCCSDTRVEDIDDALRSVRLARPDLPWVCMWLDEVGRLSPRTQRDLAKRFDVPPAVRLPAVRWVASLDRAGSELTPPLHEALARLELELPPLRECTAHFEDLVAELSARWARQHRVLPRRFGRDAVEAMEQYPWPGNLLELEAVIDRSLAATDHDPLGAADLRFAGAERDRVAETHAAGIEAPPTLGDEALPVSGGRGRQEFDATALLEGLLDERRHDLGARGLLIIKDLDPRTPPVLADPEALRRVFDALLGRWLRLAPEHGDLYLASRQDPRGGDPRVQVLLRFRPATSGDADPWKDSVEVRDAERVVRAHGGSLTSSATDPEERVLSIGLPAAG